jgi:hypothetical protein
VSPASAWPSQSEQHEEGPRRVGAVDIEHDRYAVAHRNGDVLITDDAVVLRRPLVVARRLMSGRKNNSIFLPATVSPCCFT